ncbi:hypothetical protein CC86DRAFT_461563 [Ophiobolus disseminans]|uniref:Uncharacterized protein n=1 Tax=Ophiobolus disseminans TaxID=1469910 RepID=A0A6A7AII6_9PLEO|nr:hypothetical protein CC86DRAFT_461563 [Ophiobolus disseminans]
MSELRSYKDLTIDKYLKDSIITQAKALYGMNFPNGHDWSVIVEKSKNATGPARLRGAAYRAHVIVYNKPKTLNDWTPLESTTLLRPTEKEALESLLEDLQEGLARLFKREYTYDSESVTAVGSDNGAGGKHQEGGDIDQGEGYLVDAEEDQYAEEQNLGEKSDKDHSGDSETVQEDLNQLNEDQDVDEGGTGSLDENEGDGEGESNNEVANSDDQSGCLVVDAEEGRSSDDERVADLVESDDEPLAKRVKLVRRRGFGGSYAIAV